MLNEMLFFLILYPLTSQNTNPPPFLTQPLYSSFLNWNHKNQKTKPYNIVFSLFSKLKKDKTKSKHAVKKKRKFTKFSSKQENNQENAMALTRIGNVPIYILTPLNDTRFACNLYLKNNNFSLYWERRRKWSQWRHFSTLPTSN